MEQEPILHSLRCLEEVFERITVLLSQAQTREKETFTALRNLVPTCRESSDGHQMPLKCIEKAGQAYTGFMQRADHKGDTPAKDMSMLGGVLLFPLPEEASLAITKHTLL